MRQTNAVHCGSAGTVILASDIEKALKLSWNKLKETIDALEAYHLGDLYELDVGDSIQHGIRLYKLKSGWEPWFDLAQYCEIANVDIDSMVEDLDFTQLDNQ